MLNIHRFLNVVFILVILVSWTSCRRHDHQDHEHSKNDSILQDPEVEALSRFTQPGEVVTPNIEGNVIKVNNQLCAVSRTLMDQETIGKFTGQVAYGGSNPKYKGKVFEFNYCCPMCQQKFPILFSKDPDSILRFHGLM